MGLIRFVKLLLENRLKEFVRPSAGRGASIVNSREVRPGAQFGAVRSGRRWLGDWTQARENVC